MDSHASLSSGLRPDTRGHLRQRQRMPTPDGRDGPVATPEHALTDLAPRAPRDGSQTISSVLAVLATALARPGWVEGDLRAPLRSLAWALRERGVPPERMVIEVRQLLDHVLPLDGADVLERGDRERRRAHVISACIMEYFHAE